jgi:hypothetical protein
VIALILGGAPCVWDDLAAAEKLLVGSRRLVVATNSAGFLYRGRIDAYATLHPENLAAWRKKRRGNADYRAFAAGVGADAEVVPERWPASSGGYGLQVALYELGATAAILCGVPLESAAGHLVQPGAWSPPTTYRRAFAMALPEIGGRVRSMGGWTQEVFGEPTPEWLASTAGFKPLGASRPRQRIDGMFHVKNVSDEARQLNIRLPDGNLVRRTLRPGQGGIFDTDPNQAVFARGHLRATDVSEKPTKKAAPAKAKASRRPAAKKAAPDATGPKSPALDPIVRDEEP